MQTARWLKRLPWLSALLALVLGVVARDCILIASAALLAIYVVRISMLTREAVDLMRCAMHCWVVGLVSILIATALLLIVLGMRAGLWDGNRLDSGLLLSLVGLFTLTISLSTRTDEAMGVEWFRSIVLTISMLVFAFTARSLDAMGPCLFALGVAAMTAVTGWRLARSDAAQIARSAARV